MFTIHVADPVMGSDWVFVASARVSIISLNAVFAASAVSGNRIPQYIIDDGVQPSPHTLYEAPASDNITAGQFRNVTGTTGSVVPVIPGSGGAITIPLPSITLEVGWRLRPFTFALDGGDQWTSIWMAAK
jgi:hypothetical protein